MNLSDIDGLNDQDEDDEDYQPEALLDENIASGVIEIEIVNGKFAEVEVSNYVVDLNKDKRMFGIIAIQGNVSIMILLAVKGTLMKLEDKQMMHVAYPDNISLFVLCIL